MKTARLYLMLLLVVPAMMGAHADPSGNPTLTFLENGFVANSCEPNSKQWVRCFHQKPEACEEIVRGRIRVCLDKYAADINPNMQNAAMRDISMKLARCFRAEFLDRYGAARIQSAECGKVLE